MNNNASQQQPTQISEEEAITQSFKSSLDDTISVLEGVGPLCKDIDQLIDMLKLALVNDSQLSLIRHHLTPKKMRR